MSPPQHLYESLRYVYTGHDEFLRQGHTLIHLNGQADALMRHFQHQGMMGLMGFDQPLMQQCSAACSRPWARDPAPKPITYGSNHVPLFQCPRCGLWYSGRRGTALWNAKIDEKDYCRMATALAEGTGIRTTARIFQVDKDTVSRCVHRAGMQCRRVDSLVMHHLHLEECQLDEMWSFVGKKEHHLDSLERLQSDMGDVWLHVGFEPRLKVFVAIVPGKRTLGNLRRVIHLLHEKSDGHVPLFTSDEYPAYPDAILWEYGQLARVDRQGLVGRPSQYAYLIPTAALTYATVNKTRKRGRIETVHTELNMGAASRLGQTLEQSPCSHTINTSFVERSNLHQRLNNRRLTRKTLGFSKTGYMHEAQMWLCVGYYHFVRPHASLRTRSANGASWAQRTPAMAAGMTDHIWTMKELLTFPNCYPDSQ